MRSSSTSGPPTQSSSRRARSRSSRGSASVSSSTHSTACECSTACAKLIEEGESGVMVAIRRHKCKVVSLEKVAGRLKTVMPDHPWVRSARLVGTSFGD